MNCVEAKELLQMYMDNEMSARESLDVQHHLDACPACAALLEYFAKQDEALRAFAKAETGEAETNQALGETIRAAIQNSPSTDAPKVPPAWWQRPALRRIAAVLVVALVAAFFFLRGTTPFVNDKVYADAVLDHDHHCTVEQLDDLVRRKFAIISNRAVIDQQVISYSTLAETPDLSGFGYGEPRAVICRIGGAKVLHIVYQSQSQKPLSLFLRRRDDKNTDRIIADNLLELHRDNHTIASLSDNGTDLVVVAATDEAQTSGITETILSAAGK